jgi:hypothetical protein
MSIETESNVINLLKFRRDRIHRCTMRKAIEEDSRNIYYMGASITDIARLAALNVDLTTDMTVLRNAAYIVTLADAADEDMANFMADACFGAVADQHADDPTSDPEKTYEQCLIDARHMLRDPDYARLFGGRDHD